MTGDANNPLVAKTNSTMIEVFIFESPCGFYSAISRDQTGGGRDRLSGSKSLTTHPFEEIAFAPDAPAKLFAERLARRNAAATGRERNVNFTARGHVIY
jgi:hypothetical protein